MLPTFKITRIRAKVISKLLQNRFENNSFIFFPYQRVKLNRVFVKHLCTYTVHAKMIFCTVLMWTNNHSEFLNFGISNSRVCRPSQTIYYSYLLRVCTMVFVLVQYCSNSVNFQTSFKMASPDLCKSNKLMSRRKIQASFLIKSEWGWIVWSKKMAHQNRRIVDLLRSAWKNVSFVAKYNKSKLIWPKIQWISNFL